MKPEHIKILQTLGLTATETKIYLALLEIGKALAGAIAEKAQIHRRNTYDALEQLLQYGLVSYTISNNKKYWAATHPNKIMLIIKERQNLLSSILSELTLKYNSVKLKQRVEVFEGLGGMKTFFDDMANSKKEIIMMFATAKAYARMPYYMANWDRRINKAKINIKVLLNYNAPKEHYKNYKYGNVKILPKTFVTPTQIFIYGNKSAVAIWAEEPIATLISNKEITDGFRKYFIFLWGLGRKVIY
ncbi:hypothetical protein HYS31_01695 [Candidatus Woesearchaeota archaeon]|nr:hypothetical protein [Candidatus Woesearchaeota archaeon]